MQVYLHDPKFSLNLYFRFCTTTLGIWFLRYPKPTYLQNFGSKMGSFDSLDESAKSIRFGPIVIYGYLCAYGPNWSPSHTIKILAL